MIIKNNFIIILENTLLESYIILKNTLLESYTILENTLFESYIILNNNILNFNNFFDKYNEGITRYIKKIFFTLI